MRSSKSRSRSKSNRPRSMGNIVNRVFDSSGPEGKVRGTPQQIIEKYLFLARDAQLSNDRVAAENFLQHAEHYTRMLGEAQRELAAEQEARQQQFGQGGQQGSQTTQGGQNGNQGGQNGQNGNQGYRDRNERADRGDRPERGEYRPDPRDERDVGAGDQPDLGDAVRFPGAEEDSILVETPEMKPRPAAEPRQDNRPPRERREYQGERREPRNEKREPRTDAPRKVEKVEIARAEAARPEPVTEAPPPAAAPVEASEAPAPAPKPKRAPAPRKPKAEKPAAAPKGSDPAEAAE